MRCLAHEMIRARSSSIVSVSILLLLITCLSKAHGSSSSSPNPHPASSSQTTIWISRQGNDTMTCGASLTPCLTIRYAMTVRIDPSIDRYIDFRLSGSAFLLPYSSLASAIELCVGCRVIGTAFVDRESDTTDSNRNGKDNENYEDEKSGNWQSTSIIVKNNQTAFLLLGNNSFIDITFSSNDRCMLTDVLASTTQHYLLVLMSNASSPHSLCTLHVSSSSTPSCFVSIDRCVFRNTAAVIITFPEASVTTNSNALIYVTNVQTHDSCAKAIVRTDDVRLWLVNVSFYSVGMTAFVGQLVEGK